jgi:AcrR family transcriptional regulator
MQKQQQKTIQPLTKGEKTHQRLRTIAASEFAQRGFHDTKVSDIVHASGLSQPTFYNYFESKEAAYEELVGEFRKRLEALTKTLLIETSMSQQALLESVSGSFQKFLDFLAQDADLTHIGFFQPPGCTKTKAGLASLIASNIAKEQAIGLFRADISSEQIGKCFVGMIDQMARDPATPQERAAIARGCALLFCDGMRQRA